MRLRPFAFLGVIAITLAACGGGRDGGGPGGGTDEARPLAPEEARPLCERSCDHEIMCASTTSTREDCIDDCLAAVTTWYRGDVVGTVVSCTVEQECAEDAELCLEGVEPLDAHAAYEERCAAKEAECGPTSEAPEWCPANEDDPSALLLFYAVSPEAVEDFLPCFEVPCADFDSCMHEVEGRYPGLDVS